MYACLVLYVVVWVHVRTYQRMTFQVRTTVPRWFSGVVEIGGVTCKISYRRHSRYNHVVMQGYLLTALSVLGIADRSRGHDSRSDHLSLEKERPEMDGLFY